MTRKAIIAKVMNSNKYFITAIMSAVTPAWSQGSDSLQNCFLNECFQAKFDAAQSSYEKADKLLNSKYSSLMRLLITEDDRKKLTTAEREWVKYRDSRCEGEYTLKCSAGVAGRECEREDESLEAGSVLWNCKAKVTRRRSQQIGEMEQAFKKTGRLEIHVSN